jgi:4-amino-4-deoxy-L-arabinose transferase-like glycosyltransferase
VSSRRLEETPPILVPDLLAIGFIVAWGLAWLAPGIAHPAIHNWDESFHHAVVRGTSITLWPTMYWDPLVPITDLRAWWYSGVWLHKAPAVFWWGAAMLKLFGVSTGALRSCSLIGELALAVFIYLLSRPLAGRVLGLLAAMSFVVLPWGWFLMQGHFVADVTDIAVAAFVTLGFAWLWWAVEKESNVWAFLAGASIGVAYLCKTFLALDPLGVAFAWWLLALLKFSKGGPTFKQVALMFGAFVLVATPWNVFAYLKWPDVYMRAFDHTTGFMSASSGEDVGSGARPPDAIFNEINWTVARLIPHPFTLLCGIWLLVKTLRDRDGRLVALSLWLWSTWAVHSIANVKGGSHMWNVVPAMFAAYAIFVRDTFRHPALAAAGVASFATWFYRPTFGLAATVKQALPASIFVQTRNWPDSNLVEQALLIPPAVVVVFFVGRALTKERREALTLALAAISAAALFAYAIPLNIRDLRALRADLARADQWSSSQDVGLSVEKTIEEKSVLFMDTHLDYGTTFEYLSLQFWSGRQVYRQAPDLALAQRNGYRPYLVSPSSEPYAPLPQVPAYAQLRAYDLMAPAAGPAPLPDGLTPLDKPLVNVHMKGWAARALDGRFSRYAFYAEPRGMPSDVRVIYHLDDGTSVEQKLLTQATLRAADRLVNNAWFVFPDVGPLHTRVKSIECQQ